MTASTTPSHANPVMILSRMALPAVPVLIYPDAMPDVQQAPARYCITLEGRTDRARERSVIAGCETTLPHLLTRMVCGETFSAAAMQPFGIGRVTIEECTDQGDD